MVAPSGVFSVSMIIILEEFLTVPLHVLYQFGQLGLHVFHSLEEGLHVRSRIVQISLPANLPVIDMSVEDLPRRTIVLIPACIVISSHQLTHTP